MFYSMKIEEYMESELSSIFRVKVITTNIVLGSPGTQREAVSAVWCPFLKKHTNALSQTVTLKGFPC